MPRPELRAAGTPMPGRSGVTRAPARGLQRRLMAAFALFALCLVVLFSLYALAFAYTVEDQYLEVGIEREAERQRENYLRHGEWLTPLEPNARLVFDPAAFPDDMRSTYLRSPRRREFVGNEGRHYHLREFQAGERHVWLLVEVSSRLVFRRMRPDVAMILGTSGAGALLVALLIGALIARLTTRPLSRLVDAVDALQPDQLPPQQWLQRVTAGKLREIDVLARGLDDLVQRMRAFIQREQEFTRDVSHELRTPLSVIRILSEQMAADAELAPMRRAQMESIRQSTAQLEQIVTTLLSLAREAHAESRDERSALLPVLERVVLEQAARHPAGALDLQIDVAPSVQVALGAGVLHILLSNLIGNAFAHADGDPRDAGSPRRIRIEVAGSRLCIRNASQAAPGDDDFAAFHKREGSAGFGLGLAIVRRLCDRFEVDLRIEHADGQTTASFGVIVDALSAEPR